MAALVDPSNNFKSFLRATAAFSEKDKTDIISDCKTCFTCREVEDGENYSVGSTFFVKANELPVCGLEAFAMQIFAKHTEGKSFDPARSGAEWWTQYIDHRDVSFRNNSRNRTPRMLITFLLRILDFTGIATMALRKRRSVTCTLIWGP